MPTPDEAIDAITDAWMTVTSDIPEDADPEAVEESWAGCRQEVEVFLNVLVDQPVAIRTAVIRLLCGAGENG